MKGGYKIIDFKNVSLSGTPVTMTDVLVDLLNNYDKVVLLSNVVLSGSAKDDCFSTVLSDGAGGVKLNCYDGYISINSSGAVSYTLADISTMNSDISVLKDNNGKEVNSLSALISRINGSLINKATFTKVRNNVIAEIMGVNNAALVISMKLNSSVAIMYIIPFDSKYTGIASINLTNGTISNVYTYEGVSYTP